VTWGVKVRSKPAVINHEFKFNGVFTDKASQVEVFDTAAKSIVQGMFETIAIIPTPPSLHLTFFHKQQFFTHLVTYILLINGLL
jgi:hypothetical protein